MLRASVTDGALLTLLQALVALAFLGVSLAAVHLLVGALRSEQGHLGYRRARSVLVAAGVLFVAGFVRLVVVEGVPSASLAGVALGASAIAYLLYLARPELFAAPAEDEAAEGSTEESDAESGR